MFVGYDEYGLGAALITQDLFGPGQVEAHFGAVATRLRRRGGGYADEMLEVFLADTAARAMQAGLAQFSVTAKVHESNVPSRRLCTRSGLRRTGVVTNEPELQIWAFTVVLNGDTN
jgi:RimJ/RimL family protein N-acetyltransferase